MVRTELSGDPRVYSVHHGRRAVNCDEWSPGHRGNNKKDGGEWKEAGAVRMDSRVPPL